MNAFVRDQNRRGQAQTWRWNAEWSAEQKRKWLAKYVERMRNANHAIVRAHFRVYGDDGSVVICVADRPAGWEELRAMRLRASNARRGRGERFRPLAAESLGIRGDMLRWYLAHRVVTFNGATSGKKRFWFAADSMSFDMSCPRVRL